MTHGTYAGYVTHVRRQETPCADCRAANAEYKRSHRRANVEWYRKSRMKDRAKRRALRALAEVYWRSYRSLYARELRTELERERHAEQDGRP